MNANLEPTTGGNGTRNCAPQRFSPVQAHRHLSRLAVAPGTVLCTASRAGDT